MQFRSYPRIAIAVCQIICSYLLNLSGAWAAQQELVTPFSTAVDSPTGTLEKGPDGNFWGTTINGGPAGGGVIYRVKPNGTWETVYYFTRPGVQNPGKQPGGLANDGQGNLWGATYTGGDFGWGTFFKYNVASGVLTTVHHCRNLLPDRIINPSTQLTADGKGFMWGTTPGGYIFKIQISTGILTLIAQFTGVSGAVKGSSPYARLERDGDEMWGTTSLGGATDSGTVFKVNTSTGAFTSVAEFNRNPGTGSYPLARLQSDGAGFFWSVTPSGGTDGQGVIFKLNKATGVITTVALFTADRGALPGGRPNAGLVPDDQGILWGTAPDSGSLFGKGVIFKVNPATGVATTVLAFPELDTNIIGRSPRGELSNMGGGFMMGVTLSSGTSLQNGGPATIYKINTGSNAFTSLMRFVDAGTTNVGRTPYGDVVAGSDGSLWGTTLEGGRSSCGTIYKVNPVTGMRTTVVEFTGRTGSALGNRPLMGLVPDDLGNFWGTTQMGGINDRGTLFKINQASGAITTVQQFGQTGWTHGIYATGLMKDAQGILWGTLSSNGTGSGFGGIYRVNPATNAVTGVLLFTGITGANKGSNPYGGLLDDGAGFLWGTTFSGGDSDFGTAFKLEKSTGKLTTLVSFTGIASTTFPGAFPSGRLADDSAGFIWGTTSGTNSINSTSRGTVFKINKATGSFANVQSLNSLAINFGTAPFGGLTPDGLGNLWGMTSSRGTDNVGTVFRVNAATGALDTMVQLDDALSGGSRFGSLYRHPADGHFYASGSTAGPTGGGGVFRVRLGPVPLTLAATNVLATGATVNGTVSPNAATSTISFEYGSAPDLAGATTAQITTSAIGSTPIAYSRVLTDLTPKTTYYYRITGSNAENPFEQKGQILSFRTPSNDAALGSLAWSTGGLTPAFQPEVQGYLVTLPSSVGTATLTVAPRDQAATIRVNGQPVAAGTAIGLQVATGNTLVPVQVTAEDGVTVLNYTLSVTRLPVSFSLNANNEAPLKTAGLAAGGNEILPTLGHAPVPGRSLKVVENTATGFIEGAFTGLAQGQEVILSYEGRPYRYVVNYHGGSGNDLVLHWAVTGLAVWGRNNHGQLGLGDTADGLIPVRMTQSGVLQGKTILDVAVGTTHVLALCSDGTVAAWGDGSYGKLGDGGTSPRGTPVAVDQSGVLAGKRVVAITAGENHSVVLCSDGTMAAWGANGTVGQAGNGAPSVPEGYTAVPVAVDRSGVLAGRKAVATAATANFTLALCADNTIVLWGAQSSTFNQRTPMEFPKTGALAGKVVTGFSVARHIFFHCADGSVAAYGSNTVGQLGNNSTAPASTPVAIGAAGSLSGRTMLATSAGYNHSLALCSDGRIASWGGNTLGQRGDGTVTTGLNFGNPLPGLVSNSGVLAGQQVVAVRAGGSHCLALCADGTAAAWGSNGDGQLGINSTTPSLVPAEVSMTGIPAGSRFASISTGPEAVYNVAIIGLSLPEAVTQDATQVRSLSARLEGAVRPNGQDTTAVFEWGATTSYGNELAADEGVIPAAVAARNVTHTLADLLPATVYHYRLRVTNASGTAYGEDRTFRTPNNNPFAASITTPQAFTPAFHRNGSRFSLTVPFEVSVLPVTVVAEDPAAGIHVNDVSPNASGNVNVDLLQGSTAIRVELVAENGEDKKTYWIDVVRLPQTFVYETGAEIWVSSERFVLPAVPVKFELRHSPRPGTRLMVLRSTGLEFPVGGFSNLAHGQTIVLSHEGKSYRFTANYYGGSGNDLVLEWADTAIYGWGANGSGQLGATGDGMQPQLQPTPVTGANPQALTTFATAVGYLHSVALASDGSLRAWGSNTFGQLGDGTKTARDTPAPVIASGALAGKTVVAIAAGAFHSLALYSDGSVAAWGYNNHGQLGNGSNVAATAPVAVDASGVLASRKVVAISAGAYHSLALCSDGTVVAWGFNGTGALGDGTSTNSNVPVLVQQADGETFTAVAISAGQYHNLASLAGTGQVLAWGYNNHGQLGDGSTVQKNRAIPAGASGTQGVLSAQLLASGASHSVVLAGTGGEIAAWGEGSSGQLGNGGNASSSEPVAVTKPGGVSIELLVSGADHVLAQTNNGTLVAWGANPAGQLGDGGTQAANIPQEVSLTTLEPGARFGTPAKGSSATHALAIVALPAPASGAALVEVPANGGAVGGASLAAWRTLHFGNAANTAIAQDNADPDHDGMVNLIEYAFGSDPLNPSIGSLPQSAVRDGYLVIEFMAPAEDMDVTYGAAWTREPGATSWQMLDDEGTGRHHLFRIPIDGRAGFMRLQVDPF
jgi:uncharacterized repeat protein (TIGR03803 family)